MRTLTTTILTLAAMASHAATPHRPPSQAPFIPDMDMQTAKAYCDTAPIRDPEGIYLWPGQHGLVLLKACRQTGDAPIAYEIISIESSDILLSPGQVTGYLYPSPNPEDYHLYLYSDIGLDAVTSPRHMAATFDPMRQVFEFKGKKTKVSINPLTLIPHMRSLLRVKTEDPTKDIPDGLRRIYPAPAPTPANPSLPYPRYF